MTTLMSPFCRVSASAKFSTDTRRVLRSERTQRLRRSSHDTGTQHALQFWCIVSGVMRYLVKARVKSGQELALVQAIDEGTLGQGSIAGDEYLEDCNRIPIRLGQRGARNDDFSFKSATKLGHKWSTN